MKLIYKEDGLVKGLYRGLSINYVRAIPMVALSFSTYEVMKQALNLETVLNVAVLLVESVEYNICGFVVDQMILLNQQYL